MRALESDQAELSEPIPAKPNGRVGDLTPRWIVAETMPMGIPCPHFSPLAILLGCGLRRRELAERLGAISPRRCRQTFGSERQRERKFGSRSNSRASHRAIKMGSRNKCSRKVIVILGPGSRKPVPVEADEEMCFLNGN